jgi:4-amino-4-deoxy-L-arabinose transferase-like glycosyltransferase
VLALAMALRAPVASLPFERDEGEYAYTAQRWLAGDVPYRDVFDQKPPAVFAFYAAAFAIGGESPAAVRFAGQVWAAIGLGALALLGARLFSPAVGIAAALIGLVLGSDPSWLGNAVNTEQIAATPLALAALLAVSLRGRDRLALSLAVGALGGIALLAKPVTAPIVAFEIATALALAPRRVAHAAAAALGVLALLVPTWLWFAAHGAGAAFLDAVVWNNLAYAGETKLAEYPTYFALQFRPTLVPLGPLYAAALAAPLALRSADATARRRIAWVAAWFGVSLVAVAAGGYFRQHYFALATPPLALLAALGLASLAPSLAAALTALGLAAPARALGVARPSVAPLAALAVLAWSVGVGWWYYGPATAESKLHRIYGANPFPEAPALGAWIASHSAPADRVFVYGSEPQLLFYARRASASRYMFVYPLNMPLPAAAERQRETLAEIDAAQPRFVVGVFVRTSLLVQPGTPPDLARGLRERVERDYEVAAVVPFAADRHAKILEGKPARAMWNERPLWDGATPWAAYVVWQRR